MNHSVCLIALLSFGGLIYSATAAIKSETVEYWHGDVALEGYLAYDDAREGQRPGILVVHEWKGVGAHVKANADKLAALGYVALAVDIYGKGVRPVSNEQAGAEAGKYKKDRALLRGRILAGLDRIKQHPRVDPDRIAAIGYCFGGTTALELARSGAPVAGVVSFHGGLDSPTPSDAKNIKAKVLVLHGADDPLVSPAEIAGFQDEMRKGGVDWQMISYGGAVHSFTNPEAGQDPSRGIAYNERAARRAWDAMCQFFNELFR